MYSSANLNYNFMQDLNMLFKLDENINKQAGNIKYRKFMAFRLTIGTLLVTLISSKKIINACNPSFDLNEHNLFVLKHIISRSSCREFNNKMSCFVRPAAQELYS